MTRQAGGCRAFLFSTVAALAALRERFVHFIADQPFSVAAVRVVAGKALGRLFREIDVPLLQGCCPVTGETEFIRVVDEQLSVIGLMRSVAGRAVPFCVGGMCVIELFRCFCVAAETTFSQPFVQEPAIIGGVRGVTCRAVPFLDRGMNDSLAEIPARFFMAGVAEGGNILLQEIFVTGHVWVMAGAAVVVGNRFVGKCFFKEFLLVAFEADILSLPDCGQEK